jgi:diaminohydroxyphosphoribosylaminopyrimidine deaminase / 5-amino-6-(5-phosphoribosylamino)uracil reductase
MNEPAGAESLAAQTRGLDRQHMQRALALAERGWGQTAPNPMVGAVVVAGGEIVGEGFHERFGEAHAEINALRAAGDRARGATMFVTLEPCAHHGKTPPCADVLVAANVSRVVIAVRDPSRVARGGAEKLRSAGIRVDVGLEEAAALELNAPFFNAQSSDLPWVTLKLALSSDDGVADPTGTHRWITGPESRREVHRLRANADAIAVGVGTVLADDPELTVRDAPAPRVAPRRVVFDSEARTPLTSKLVRSARDVPTTLFTTDRAPAERLAHLRDRGVDIEHAASLRDALVRLRATGVRSLFVEAGPRLAGAFLNESLVDRLTIFRSPLVLGGGAPRAFEFAPVGFSASLDGFRPVNEGRFGDDTMTTYVLHEISCLPD